ncbi:hypothetical protein [Oceanirhabdus seepicola]|uniref:Uncharacterized protein n=1 Tax=Oceanirhabdus seepicola TaxID=2828781 RepID=A0A9J6P4B6_9CLOT|nr:hypothetical protein [Oceanirhabdus seepicola]MCM1990448.1 hypothetical protein [Oceanirhabdus seepicola]
MLKKSRIGKEQRLSSLLEYRLEYKEEQNRLDKEAKREIENNLLFIGM